MQHGRPLARIVSSVPLLVLSAWLPVWSADVEKMERGPAQARLDFLVGEWSIRSKMHMSGKVHEETNTANIEWLPGGVWLEESVDIPHSPIGPMFGVAHTAWDAAAGEYVRHWMDNQSTVVLTQRGRFTDDATLEMAGSFEWTDGTTLHQRLVIRRTPTGWTEEGWMGRNPEALRVNHEGTATPAGDGAARAMEGPAPAPDWFKRHVAFMTADGGRWIADNSAYRNDQETADAYGLEWQAGLGGQGMTGRLFGLRDGAEVGTYWNFRLFWHPGERKVHAMQWGGNGAVGIGVAETVGAASIRMEQVFHAPDGSRTTVGHESSDKNGKAGGSDEHVTRSFDVDADGTWQPRRVYTWRR